MWKTIARMIPPSSSMRQTVAELDSGPVGRREGFRQSMLTEPYSSTTRQLYPKSTGAAAEPNLAAKVDAFAFSIAPKTVSSTAVIQASCPGHPPSKPGAECEPEEASRSRSNLNRRLASSANHLVRKERRSQEP